jgi:hypothetical protein
MAAAATASLNVADHLDNGRNLVYPGDAYLETPEVYYHPQKMALRFKVFDDQMPADADPQRWRPRRYQLEEVVKGRYVAFTVMQRDAIRRVLGQRADRWRGDDLPKELVCHQKTCGFATRNSNAYEDHQQFFNRHEPQPDLSRFY